MIKNTIITALSIALIQSQTGWFALPMWRLVVGMAMAAAGAQIVYRINRGGLNNEEN